MDYATPEGTASYKSLKNIEDYHFRKSVYTSNLTLSSLGMGTYLGSLNHKTDLLVEEAIKESILSGGINIIDTAINYRYQKAERSIGRVLSDLINQSEIKREQIFISTKNGYIPGDADKKMDPNSYLRQLQADIHMSPSDFVSNSHSMNPTFLEHELNQSLNNLQLRTIDLLYLHNTAEAQLGALGKKKYLDNLREAFLFLEQKRSEKKIRFYGLATWTCFRVSPTKKKEHVNLQDVCSIAEEVGGTNSGFKFVQLPLNTYMHESFTEAWQVVDNEKVSFLNASDKLKIGIFGSVPLLQTKLLNTKTPNFSGLESKAQKLLQFVRSIPHQSVIGPLIGQKKPDHVQENMEVMFEPPVSKESFYSYLGEITKKNLK